jgi:hypothetical protein
VTIAQTPLLIEAGQGRYTPDLYFGKTEIFLSKGLDKRTEYDIANDARRANQARRRKQEYGTQAAKGQGVNPVNSAWSTDVCFGA